MARKNVENVDNMDKKYNNALYHRFSTKIIHRRNKYIHRPEKYLSL